MKQADLLKRKLLRRDPFAWSLLSRIGPVDRRGWNGIHPALERMVVELRPRVVFDIGVWKGQSTMFLGRALKRAQIDGVVIAIDTWLGSPEHWDAENPRSGFRDLRLRGGYPTLFHTFRKNILRSGLARYVLPLPQTSLHAAELLARAGITAQLIHLDAAHDHDSVLADCRAFWKLLDRGGVLIGDDYVPDWPGVRTAADLFCKEQGLSLTLEHPKWIVRKP